MDKTKPDISANKVTIPLNNLIEVAEIAVGKSRASVERNLTKIQEIFAYQKENKAFDALMVCRNLRLAAEQLEKSINILHCLESARTREVFEVTK